MTCGTRFNVLTNGFFFLFAVVASVPMRAVAVLALPMLLALPSSAAGDGCSFEVPYGPIEPHTSYAYVFECAAPQDARALVVDDVVSAQPCFKVQVDSPTTMTVFLWTFSVSSLGGDTCATTLGTLDVWGR